MNISHSRTIYDVSYCFFGITGILITILVSSITSLFTGESVVVHAIKL